MFSNLQWLFAILDLHMASLLYVLQEETLNGTWSLPHQKNQQRGVYSIVRNVNVISLLPWFSVTSRISLNPGITLAITRDLLMYPFSSGVQHASSSTRQLSDLIWSPMPIEWSISIVKNFNPSAWPEVVTVSFLSRIRNLTWVWLNQLASMSLWNHVKKTSNSVVLQCLGPAYPAGPAPIITTSTSSGDKPDEGSEALVDLLSCCSLSSFSWVMVMSW